ncbi:hypothetical protein RJ639_034062, partial [Escallonia herrerae]
MVSPSCIITRRSPLGSAARGTTGTQFFPSEAEDSSATETSVALHAILRGWDGGNEIFLVNDGLLAVASGCWDGDSGGLRRCAVDGTGGTPEVSLGAAAAMWRDYGGEDERERERERFEPREGKGREWRWVLRNNPPNSNPTVGVEVEAPHMALDTASNVVRKFYDGINGRNLAAVEDLIADDCIYEDLGSSILEFFQTFVDSISADLQFVIDDISDEDTTAVGVTWHLELRGKPFPFSKGCSFYRVEVLNGQRKIRCDPLGQMPGLQ